MPASLFTRIDLDKLYPPFLEKLLAAIADAQQRGINYTATLGYRTYAEQDALFAKRPKVTNARGGESAHNFGIACDFYDGTWDAATYNTLGVVARAQGLVWGGDWTTPDRPHVQLAGFVTGDDMEPLRAAFAKGGLPAVFAYLDSVA